MKKSLLLLFIVFIACVFFPGRGWTEGMHFGGGQFSSGHHHFGGGMYRNFGNPGPYTNYGSPAFRSPGFGHSPYHPHSPYFGPQHSYRRGVPFFLPGFSSHRFVYRHRVSPAGPPPVGAPAPTPVVPATPTHTPTYFYCAKHSFHYTNQKAFFEHLNFAHKVPLKHADAYCQPIENGLIFSRD